MMRLQPGQNIIDFALRQYGNASAIVQVIQDNPTEVSYADPYVAPGADLRVSTTPYLLPAGDPVIVNAMRTRQITPALHEHPGAGVNYWGIETTFVVQ
jgi:hypothetical protein